MSDAAIETERLSKLYPGGHGIAELTMSVAAGEVFGFLGPNGAGKTTTIRTLLDLIHPTAGSARLLGLDSRRDSVAIRRRVGNLPGDFGFGRETTGRQALDLLARLRGAATDRAGELTERFRADLDRPLGELSRGNRQKVGLILAAFHRPELLVLDEPTGGLDPMMQEEFLALVGEERDRGATVFLSSHELDEVERICDRVGIVRDARLVAVERVPDLLGRARRKVSVHLADGGGLEELRRLAGVSDVERFDGGVSFRFAGDVDPVVKALATHHVTDLEVSRPTLEEVFLGYYEGGEEER
ncbi:MAG TPA: ABC transporter ATP-binding protein [Solirubrobacterales bacterium]|nr:ABC transporter ATP-binding protein [Solirubrobacterales bacterium]